MKKVIYVVIAIIALGVIGAIFDDDSSSSSNDNNNTSTQTTNKESIEMEEEKNEYDWLIGRWACDYWDEGVTSAPITGIVYMNIVDENTLIYDGSRTTYRIIDNELIIKDPDANGVSIVLPIDKERHRIFFGETKFGTFYFYKR